MEASKQESSPSLLSRLQELGGTVSPQEVPSNSELPAVVGAIVKVLEDRGVDVSDDLFPSKEGDAERVKQLEAELAALKSDQEQEQPAPAPAGFGGAQ